MFHSPAGSTARLQVCIVVKGHCENFPPVSTNKRKIHFKCYLSSVDLRTFHEVIKLLYAQFTFMSRKFVFVMNFIMPTIVGILKFITRTNDTFICS